MTNIIINPNILKFIIILSGSFLILFLIKLFIIKQLVKLFKKTKNDYDDLLVRLISKIHAFAYLAIALFIATKYSNLTALEDISSKAILVFAFYYGVIFALEILKFFIDKKKTPDNKQSITLIHKVLNVVIWLFALLFLLQNFGINITSLITGLGVAGVAFAFAIQNILEDIFAYFTIHFDKPFKVGDFINVGEDFGTVKKIGLKSTRIENLLGDELVFSNRELTETRVHNYKKMEKRRNTITIGVEYSTDFEKLKEIKDILKNITKEIKDIELYAITFDKLNSFSLDFKLIYYVLNGDYNRHLEIQETLNYEIIKAFREKDIHFAFPSQTLYIQK